MSNKLFFLISFVLVLSLAGNVLGYDIMTWDNNLNQGDRLWHTGTNWKVFKKGPIERHGAPVATEWAVIDRYGEPNGPIITADTIAEANWVDLGGVQSPFNEAVLTMTGGTLTAGTWLDMGGYYPGTYRFDMSGGTIIAPYIYVGYVTDAYATMNISDGNIITETEFMIGVQDTSYGEVNMTGGDVNLGGWLEIGSSWAGYLGKGNLDLKGGTIETILLSMGGGGVGTMNFAYDGALIIDGDYRVPNDWLFDPCSDTPLEWDDSTGAINPPVDWDGYMGTIAILASRGLITAYGTKVGEIITDVNYPDKLDLRAVIYLDYGVANPGQTTLTGGAVSPDLAWDPDPLVGSADSSKDVNLIFSWAAGDNAASHEVYFGTSFDNVNDANTSVTLGVYEGNQPLADVNYPVSVTWGTTYYWRIDEVNDPNTWKGTVWNFATKKAWATNPTPFGNATGVDAFSPISWDPGPEANDASGHYVYLSTDFNDVNDRDPNVMTVRDPNNYAPFGGLELNTRYWWAVDEVNLSEDPNIWPSVIWRFNTAAFLNVDNLNPYAADANIQAVWRKETDPDADAVIEVATDPRRGTSGKSMMYAYRNALTSGAEANAVTTDLFAGTDWTAKGVEALMLYFYGDAGNGQEMHAHSGSAAYTVDNDQMYVALEDGDANVGIVKYYDKVEGYDMNDIQEEFWHQWNIDLADPCLADVNMANVVKIYIGFGGAKTGQTVNGVGWKSGNYDTVWFDDIRLYPPRCRSVKVEHDIAGGDCITDYNDVDIMGRDWLMYDYNVAAVPISGDPCGWWQLDEAKQSTAVDISGYGNDGTIYNYDWVGGYPNDPNDSALHFDGDGLATYDRVECAVREGNTPGNYPAELMPATFTVACWVKVANFEYYDGLVVNGDDYGETGQHSSGFYLYAADDTGVKDFGLGIRTEDGMYYVDTPDIYETGTWYHLAATYNDANKASVYVDGKLAAGPTDVGGPIRWRNYEDDFPKYFLIGALHASDVLDWYRAQATIDDVRVYGYALPYGEIVTLAEQGPVLYHDVISPANISDLEAKLSKIVNFRDYRMMADHWLEDPILWP